MPSARGFVAFRRFALSSARRGDFARFRFRGSFLPQILVKTGELSEFLGNLGRNSGKKCYFSAWHGRCYGSPQMNTVELDLDTASMQGSETVIHLPCGLLGFERSKKYLLTTKPEEEPFHWFQVLDDSSLTFLVLSPFEVLPSYRPDLPAEDVRFLQLEQPEDALLLNIVSLRPKGRSTINLKGPIVVNRFTLIGKQVIITNAADYSVQHPLPEEGR
jgi:flagellar assembly factor FliW